jgi:putative exporter of polyketide antibiotics
MFGALLEVPGWFLALSAFHDIGLVPAEPFDATGAAIMIAIATLAALAAVEVLRRRNVAA